MPHGRFDHTMEGSVNGESVEACGPLLWDGVNGNRPATGLTIKHVEIRQGNALAVGDPSLQLQRGPANWMVEDIPAEGPGKFEEGDAHAKAEVDVVLQDGSTKTETWNQTVELTL
jgi:hypothetical protein